MLWRSDSVGGMGGKKEVFVVSLVDISSGNAWRAVVSERDVSLEVYLHLYIYRYRICI